MGRFLFHIARPWLALLLALWMAPGRANGQVLPSGQRIRISTVSSTMSVVGSLERMDADSVILFDGARRLAFARSTVARLEVSTGRRGHVARGLGVGALVGLALSAAIAGPNDDWGCGYHDTGDRIWSRQLVM